MIPKSMILYRIDGNFALDGREISEDEVIQIDSITTR